MEAKLVADPPADLQVLLFLLFSLFKFFNVIKIVPDFFLLTFSIKKLFS